RIPPLRYYLCQKLRACFVCPLRQTDEEMVSGVTDVATIESSRCLNLLNDFCYKKLLEFFADARHFTLASRCARLRHGYVTNLIKRRGRRGFRRGTQRA